MDLSPVCLTRVLNLDTSHELFWPILTKKQSSDDQDLLLFDLRPLHIRSGGAPGLLWAHSDCPLVESSKYLTLQQKQLPTGAHVRQREVEPPHARLKGRQGPRVGLLPPLLSLRRASLPPQ